MIAGDLAIVGAIFGNLQLAETTMIDLIGPIEVYAGDTATYRLTVTDDTDARVDLTGATITLQIAATIGGTPVISKTLGSGWTLLDQTSPDTKGQADVALAGADTRQPLGLYQLDVVVELAGGRTHVIPPRDWTVIGVVNAGG